MNNNLLFNKLFAIGLIALGVLSCVVFEEHDATFLIFTIPVAISLFFAKENWIK